MLLILIITNERFAKDRSLRSTFLATESFGAVSIYNEAELSLGTILHDVQRKKYLEYC